MNSKKTFFQKLTQQKFLLCMSLPFVVWLFIFAYLPLFGWVMAFQEFKLKRSLAESFFTAEWVGLTHFKEMFQDDRFFLAIRNTLGMSLLGITIGFVIPILFAILINELKDGLFKKTVQTVSYLPHFISWVVAAGMISQMLASSGPINEFLIALGIIDKGIPFLGKGKLFWGIITAADIWKEVGWNAIIFLAAITGIDPGLYEAAGIDGAGRFRKIWHITLPSISGVIVVILVMNIGWLMNVGFERQFLLGNDMIREYAEVIDLYVLRFGIGMGRYSYGTAVGIFRSAISVFLLLLANTFAKRVGKGSVI